MIATRAVWSSAYINDLPDSSFLYIEPGGDKDGEGKTTPRSLRHFPVKDANGNVDLPHLRNALSRIPQSNLPDSVKSMATAKAQRMLAQNSSMGEIGEVRFQDATDLLFELHDSEANMPKLVGHFAVFDQWTEINSRFEGNFLERIAPGAFRKTFAENQRNMRVLFQHGKDFMGEQILGRIDSLSEDTQGARYEVQLYDGIPQLLMDGLRDGAYGASFRFRAMKEDWTDAPQASDYNPDGLRERTITEAKVMEFGPVTFPAYEGASAGLRSGTDWFRGKTLEAQFEEFLGNGAAALDTEVELEQSDNFVPTPSRRTRSRVSLRAEEEVQRLP